MRLTKRQLKRIIREEYSRLKRRGLIKEAYMPMTQAQITFELFDGGEWNCNVPEHIAGQLDDLMAAEAGEYGQLSPEQMEDNQEEMMMAIEELYGVCEEMAFDSGATEEGLGAPMSCSHDGLWALIQKAAQRY